MALLVALTTAACSAAVVSADPPPSVYDGPLATKSPERRSPPDKTLGAAGAAVQCRSAPVGGVNDPAGYGGETGSSAERGLQEAIDEGSIDGPKDGWQADRAESDRQLFSVFVDGQRKAAVVMALGDVVGNQHGWYAESYAHCNIAEFPAAVVKKAGVELWTDSSGVPVDTRKVVSVPGHHDCLWGLVLLHLGADPAAEKEGDTYVRRGTTTEYPSFFNESFRSDAALPASAVDTGYRQGDRVLWLSADRRRAYVGVPGAPTVELWPRTTQVLGCA